MLKEKFRICRHFVRKKKEKHHFYVHIELSVLTYRIYRSQRALLTHYVYLYIMICICIYVHMYIYELFHLNVNTTHSNNITMRWKMSSILLCCNSLVVLFCSILFYSSSSFSYCNLYQWSMRDWNKSSWTIIKFNWLMHLIADTVNEWDFFSSLFSFLVEYFVCT